jgi:ribosome recycling factor
MPDDSIDAALNEARQGMEKALNHFRSELQSIRTGRASPAMLQNIKVDYYGSQTPLEQIASVTAPQADLLLIQPFDVNALEDIEKAIMKSDLGFNPGNDGSQIRVPVPPLSEERRKELAKKASERAEEARISIRNTRRSAKEKLKKLEQDENLSEDVRYAAEQDLQSLTDEYTGKVDQLVERKEEEIMQV